MKRLLTRGGLYWVVTGVLVYACGGDARRFVDPNGEEGGAAGAGDSGGSSSGGRGGASGSSGSGTSGDAGGPAGDGGSATGGSGNRGGTSGSGGTTDPGGAGGEAGDTEPPPPPGRPGTALVAGGEYMSSTNYKMFLINGNGSLRVTSSSANYSLRGGIVGTTQP
jgi:hypothetical protein